MDAEYAALALRIAAAYPSAFISDLTLADWVDRLNECDDFEHAERTMQKLRNLPSPPDPIDWRNARRDTRQIEYHYALPAPKMTPEDKAEMRRVMSEVFDAWRAKHPAAAKTEKRRQATVERKVADEPPEVVAARARDAVRRLHERFPEEFRATTYSTEVAGEGL